MECGLGFRFKKKEKIFAECPDLALGKLAALVLCQVSGSGTRQRSGLPSAYPLALGKPGRQAAAVTWRRFLPNTRVCRVPDTRQKGPLPSVWLCRVPDTRQSLLCRVYIFAECGTRQRASSAKKVALGKDPVSRSDVSYQQSMLES